MPAKYPKHAKVVALAKKEIGVHEEPWGSNRGERVHWYQAATWLKGTGWPWCAAFCVRMARQAGFVLAYLGAGAYAWYDKGAQLVGKKIPANRPDLVVPGDFVVLRMGSGHIGIVEKIVDGAIHTIEGNTSDQVAARIRPLHLVYGFVHLDEKAVTPPRPPKAPRWEVVTSESGHRVIYVSGIKAISLRLPRFVKRYGGVIIRRKR